MRGVADGGGIQIGGEEKILLSHGYDEVFSFFCRHRGNSITMSTKRGGKGASIKSMGLGVTCINLCFSSRGGRGSKSGKIWSTYLLNDPTGFGLN